MALITCVHCNRYPVSDQAPVCPQCGKPPTQAAASPSAPPVMGAIPPMQTPVEPAPARPNYTIEATAASPGLYIFLLDISHSMLEPLASGTPKLRIVQEAYKRTMQIMLRRCLKGEVVSERYGVILLGYGETVVDYYGRLLSIREAAAKSLDLNIQTQAATNTALGFRHVKELLKRHLPNTEGCPAPVICHITDGMFTPGGDPSPVVYEIQQMGNSDGRVLIENVYVGDNLTKTPINDAYSWPGAHRDDLVDDYVKVLWDISSPLPKSYAENLANEGFSMNEGSRMLFPGASLELVELAFVTSTATKYA